MKRTSKTLILVILLTNAVCYSQNIDSLKQALQKAKHDIVKCSILNLLVEAEPDDKVWPKYNEELKNICEKNLAQLNKDHPDFVVLKKHYASSLNNFGYLAIQQNDPLKGIEYSKKSVSIYEEIGDKEGLASALNNLGVTYTNQGQILKALDAYKKCIKLWEELGENSQLSNTINNLGRIYHLQGDHNKSLEYYQRSYEIEKEMKNGVGIANSLNNIGLVYHDMGNYSKALEYYRQGVELGEKLGNKHYMANLLYNTGLTQQSIGDTATAIENFQKSLVLYKEINDKAGMTNALLNFGWVYFYKKKYELALNNITAGKKLAIEIGYPEYIKNAASLSFKIYKKMGNYEKALENYELYTKMRDSVNNENTRRESYRSQLQYQYDKQAAADSVAYAKEAQVKNAELAKQKSEINAKRNQQYALYGGLALVIVFAGFMYNRFKITQKQKHIISQQKHLVEEKQKEIVDSINYAKRIQYTLLASHNILKENLCDHFVYFNPKDIVSGDFYWVTKHSNKFYIALCDSTGHGVPGAFMSLLNIGFLTEAINEKGIEQPHEVLNFVRKRLIDNISKEGQKDGFDGVLLCIDKTGTEPHITYAAANNPVVLIRNSNLEEMPYDRMPVGMGETVQSFKLYTIDAAKGDHLYLSTDGFADQFGGPKGKKFKYEKLYTLFSSIHSLPPEEQKIKMQNAFNDWKGNLEQVDDVCVLGFKL